MRQSLLAIARRLHLLPALERVRFVREAAGVRRDNAAFARAAPDFAPPPLWWMHDMYAHASYRLYWESGQRDAATLTALIERHLGRQAEAVAEWGCGLARILRHMPTTAKRTGTDLNGDAIAWARSNIADIEFVENDLTPPWPLAAGSQDVIYAISVFTHLSQTAEAAWVEAIADSLKPGGLFIFTVHGRYAPGQLLPDEQRAFDAGEAVYRANVAEGSRLFASYHPEPAVRRRFEARFDAVAGPADEMGQTLWVFKKSAGAPDAGGDVA